MNKWIKISESTYEEISKHEEFLVNDGKKVYCCQFWERVWPDEPIRFYFYFNEMCEEITNVTHWMPFPKLPKEESEDNYEY